MRTRYSILVAGVVFLILVSLLGQADAFSIRELLGIGEEQAGAESAQEPGAPQAGHEENADTNGPGNWAAPKGAATKKEFKFSEIQLLLANIDKKQRDNLLSSEKIFKQFVHQELNNLSVLAAAESNQLQKDPNTLFLMQRSAENVLREIYLRRLIASKIPAGFPSEEQLKSYYDKNKSEFVLGKRVYVWQIFLPITEGMNKKDRSQIEKKAKTVFKDVETGKLSFAEAALKYSENIPSKNNGGYMGLLQEKDLLPEIKTALDTLPEGKLSQPVKTDTGWHILKRGARLDAQDIPFEQAKGQIRNLLLSRAQVQLRNAIFEQAAKTYPVEVSDSRIEEWRLRLRTNLDENKNKPDTAKAQ